MPEVVAFSYSLDIIHLLSVHSKTTIMTATKIDQKITGFTVKKPETTPATLSGTAHAPAEEQVSEKMQRPECLAGNTYKVVPPEDKALYVTINHYTMNEGQPNERNVPFEIFIEGGSVAHRQWVSLSTRLITSIWRKGGNCDFIVEDMKETFDPKGGYFIPGGGGRFANSIVAHIGFVIEKHLQKIGNGKKAGMSSEQMAIMKAHVANKAPQESAEGVSYPANATVCASCSTKAVILLDGCKTCLNCGASKCS